MMDLVERRIAAALARLRILARGRIERVKTTGARVVLQLSGLGEVLENAQLLQQYGLASVPRPGGEGVVFFLGPDAKVVLATEDSRYRLELDEGAVALYNDQGDKVHLKGGSIDITSSGTITIDGGQIDIGAGASQHTILGELFGVLFNAHTHADPVSGMTGPPATLMGSGHLSEARVK